MPADLDDYIFVYETLELPHGNGPWASSTPWY
jgi:hypothetical protein